MALIEFRYPDGGKPSEVLVQEGGNSLPIPGDRPFPLNLEPGVDVTGRYVVFTPPYGFWAVTIEASLLQQNHVTIEFPALGGDGPLGWWHHFYGIRDLKSERGRGIRVGIIDEALAPQLPTSCISHVQNDGGAAWSTKDPPRAREPLTNHGGAVCALLTSRANSQSGYAGIVPHAEVFFSAAGADESEGLDRQRLLASISYLSEYRRCDVISVSAGDSRDPLPDIAAAVEDAADRGTACFFAAGNQGRPFYPARYDTCLAVAAIGKRGTAPTGTFMKHLETHESEDVNSSDVFVWSKSARGPEIEFCAPGVAVVWSKNGTAASASFGTSFACPVHSGVAALLLSQDQQFRDSPRDRNKYNRAIAILTSACRPLGSTGGQVLVKYGRLYI